MRKLNYRRTLRLPGNVRTRQESRDRHVTVYTTAAKTDHRLRHRHADVQTTTVSHSRRRFASLSIRRKTFQTFLGIGGALTDASAETFAKLPKAKQQEFLEAYYDPRKGIGYTLGRTNIHSCDFSSGSYTYVDGRRQRLKSFSVEHDQQFRIPFIKQALAAAGGKLNIFASPWSPPAFMKDNNDMLHGGKLKPEFYQSWANYYVKFIRAYEREGIPIWGMTIQNEPMATQKWESCIYSAEEERDFLKNYLGPTIKKEGLAERRSSSGTTIAISSINARSTILTDPKAAQYVWGIGFTGTSRGAAASRCSIT